MYPSAWPPCLPVFRGCNGAAVVLDGRREMWRRNVRLSQPGMIDWPSLLTAWSKDLMHTKLAQRVEPPRQSPDWLGYDPATASEIQELEQRLGASLPSSYKAFFCWPTIRARSQTCCTGRGRATPKLWAGSCKAFVSVCTAWCSCDWTRGSRVGSMLRMSSRKRTWRPRGRWPII